MLAVLSALSKMSVENEILQRLVSLEADTKHILANFEELKQVSERVIRLQEADSKQKEQIDILFDRSRELDVVSADLNKWVNRGVGAYLVGVVFGSLISFFIVRMIDQYDSQIKTHGELLITIDRRIAWVEFDQKGHRGKEDREREK